MELFKITCADNDKAVDTVKAFNKMDCKAVLIDNTPGARAILVKIDWLMINEFLGICKDVAIGYTDTVTDFDEAYYRDNMK